MKVVIDNISKPVVKCKCKCKCGCVEHITIEKLELEGNKCEIRETLECLGIKEESNDKT